MTFDDVVRLTAELPETEVGTSYGTSAIRVRRTGICRMWSDREHDRDGVDRDDTEVLVVFCDLEEKDALIASSNGTLFSTPHYDGYPAMLIRLADVGEDDLADLLEDSYRIKAPRTLVRRPGPSSVASTPDAPPRRMSSRAEHGPTSDGGETGGVLGEWSPVPRDGVRLDILGHRLRLVAERDLVGVATGDFASPSCGVRWAKDRFADDLELCGFAFTQFALPVVGDRDLDLDFSPSPDLSSQSVVLPMIGRSRSEYVLIAPISNPHEQVIAVTDGGLTWGWHGDLDRVPAGFVTEVGIYRGATLDDLLAAWVADLRNDADTAVDVHVDRHLDPLLTHLSYWTDNGAAYWYRTEADRTIAESVVEVVASLRADGVPIRSVELDSWWYRHAVPRPIAEIGYPKDVPPTGLVEWSARPDAFPPAWGDDPMSSISGRLDDAPLVLHARHLAPDVALSDTATDWWTDAVAVHPTDPEWFRRWFVDARRWGSTVIELDWMMVTWFFVRALREEAGRAADWQRGLDRLADEYDVGLLWCMPTPADLVLAAQLDRVVAVRTCDDYRFADDPAFLWTWFLTVNRLSGALGIPAFKDCFFSSSDVDGSSDAIDGDAHAEVEALLAALSGGPVGIGDRIGRTDREVVMRTCDDDGRLRRLDGPLALVDRCLFGGPARGEALAWATTTATTADGTWTYVVALNTSTDRRRIHDTHEFDGERFVHDWRGAAGGARDHIEVTLDARDWGLWIVAPTGVSSLPPSADAARYVVVESEAASWPTGRDPRAGHRPGGPGAQAGVAPKST